MQEFEFDKEINFDSLSEAGIKLSHSEKIKWQDKPKLTSYLLNQILYLFKLAIVYGCIVILNEIVCRLRELDSLIYQIAYIFTAFLIVQFLYAIYKFVEHTRITYLITNERLIILSRKSNYFSIKHQNIVSVKLKKSIIDRLLSTATISIYTGIEIEDSENAKSRVYYYIESCENFEMAYTILSAKFSPPTTKNNQ